ncbi:MAG: ATP-binding protein [Aquabacterium sp.]
MSIRTRLFLLVLAVWLPAAVAFALLARTTYERESASARQAVQQQAQALSQLIEREMDKRAAVARTLSASVALKERDIARFYQAASTATQGRSDWVVLLTREAQIANTLVPLDLSRTMPRSSDGSFVTGEPQAYFYPTVPVLKRPVVAIVAPELSVSPAVYNVAVAFTPSVIQALLDEMPVVARATVAVLDSQHRLVARNRDPQKWLGVFATKDLQQRIEDNDIGFAESVTLDGIPSLTYLAKPNRYGWATVMALPQEALTASAREATFHALAATGGLLLIGLAMALYAGRRISRPILALQDAADALGLERVPPQLITGVTEADVVSQALHEAGVRSRDATRRLEERVSEAVQQAQEAQAKLLDAQKHEAIGRLTGGLAHDFNNVLQTISTALQVMDRSATTDAQRRVLTAAQRACSKAASLVRQMLTFGRAEPLEPHSIDLNDFLLNTRELTGKAVGQNVRLSAAIAPGTPALYVDPTQLELALLNLVFNARDAMPKGGHIRITARLATPEEAAPLGTDPYVRLEVADDGLGMDTHTLAKAFEPYFTTKSVGAGTGLGLAQVRAFARQSGGEVRIESTLGQGTRVAMFLPICKPSLALSTADAIQDDETRHLPLTVLMVEDDALVSSVVAPALEAAGHTVQLCHTADEALDVIRNGWQGDVLFTDVVMPGTMSGLDLVAWCREHRPGLRAVVATGYTTQHAEPGVTVLRKPYEIQDLLMALQDTGALEPA